MTELDLAAEFPVPDRQDWIDAVENVLRGKPFETVLVSTTRDGLEVQPLYTAADGGPAGPPMGVDPVRLERGWDVRQVHDAHDPAACGRGVVDELERGVTSVELVAPADGWTAEALDRATAGVLFDLAAVVLAPHSDTAAARALAALAARRGGADSTRSWAGLDPIGEVARGGTADAADVIAVAAELRSALPAGCTVTVDSTRYGDAGATEAQELAWSVATGVAYLRRFEAVGVAPADAASTIGFRMSVGADQFVSIATVRASRRLWTRVLESCGVDADAHPQRLQAVTSRAMFSRRDPWVNILRSTTAALAAGVGGADAVTVLPFDDAIGEPDGFARRLARNTQLLLLEESQLARVADPAGGAWFVESLTERLAEAAWTIFQSSEAGGGIEAALADGSVSAEVDAAWSARLGGIASRRTQITGVSEFPDLEETALERPPRDAGRGLPVRRLAEPFEQLRDAADRVLASTGTRPTVHLATLGGLALHTTRTTWISNLLAVGGIATIGGEGDGAQSPIEAAARFAEDGSPVAVICSTDGVYAERGAATARALHDAGARRVVLAGAPGDRREELESAGVDEFWHVGIDVLDTLTRLHHDLGV